MVAKFEPMKNNFTIIEKYYFHPNTKLYENYLGYWSEKSGLQMTNETFFARRWNFYNESILVRPYYNVSKCKFDIRGYMI